MKKIFFSFFFFLFSFFCFAQSPYENAGTKSNLFTRFDLSPRVSALGGTFAAIANDENSLLYNPAGLSKSRLSGVAFNHTQWFLDIRAENLLFLYKLKSDFGMGIGISYMGMPNIQETDETGLPTSDEINVSSSIIQLGLGYKIFHGVMIGIGFKHFNDNLAGFSASGFALDAGILFETIYRGLNFGFAVQNIADKMKYDCLLYTSDAADE